MHTVCMCSLNVLHQATNEFIWCFLWLASPPNYPAPTLHLGSPSVYFGWPHIASVQYCGYCLVLQAGFWWSFLCNWSAAFLGSTPASLSRKSPVPLCDGTRWSSFGMQTTSSRAMWVSEPDVSHWVLCYCSAERVQCSQCKNNLALFQECLME